MGKKIKTWSVANLVVMTLRRSIAVRLRSPRRISYVTEEQRRLRAYFTFRPFLMNWSFTRKDSFRRCPVFYLYYPTLSPAIAMCRGEGRLRADRRSEATIQWLRSRMKSEPRNVAPPLPKIGSEGIALCNKKKRIPLYISGLWQNQKLYISVAPVGLITPNGKGNVEIVANGTACKRR